LTTTKSINSRLLASISFLCSSSVLLANIPPCIFGCKVLTLPPRISGELVKSATLITGILASIDVWQFLRLIEFNN